ncbi:hypothetical protein HRM2_48820 [Desulforapulum autotrophicum HRM2]|uniref:Uncharacterized protein n=1 Tax=Desulforapulum autotrophicum (strain ATCC 43914 / DSM 3382 / VKM B-1955 / HRM2) TaxID=177437 RepID=C0QII6_DESAH|nr:hypothetical protein HRM2_48820 [Desulforapulum autotrophicum HRM2]
MGGQGACLFQRKSGIVQVAFKPRLIMELMALFMVQVCVVDFLDRKPISMARSQIHDPANPGNEKEGDRPRLMA